MSASTLSARAVTRLPVPHLFMVLSLGIFALMAMFAFAPPTAADGDPAATVPAPDSAVLLAMDAGIPVVSTAGASGSPATAISNRLAVVSLGVLAVLLLVTFRAGRMRAHGSGRPVLGLVAGLLAGIAAAASLFSLEAITSASPVWVYLPVVLATLGTALGVTAPFRRTASHGLQALSG